MLTEQYMTVLNQRKPSQVRRVVLGRLDASMTSFINPIERWPDKNHMPRTLAYAWTHYPDCHELIAPMHGFAAHDLRVELNRGHVIILLAQDEGEEATTRREYYCEVPIPPDADGNAADVEIASDFVTVRLARRKTLWAMALATTRRLIDDIALLDKLR
ncbi:MAG: Hsp20/alpha crystallin family protein [Anaerolineae bacterium]|nr:Hsp20/alpha crystallin family protein [Anaerolineae bacterium]